MNKTAIQFIFLGIGLALGYVLGLYYQPSPEMDMFTENEMSSHDMTHSHGMIEVNENRPIPTVAISAMKDTKDGYNLLITTENYNFTPEAIAQDSVQREGHAHLYVNGTKVARLYGNWFHLPNSELDDGENVIQVTLNANDHRDWVVDGATISSSVTVSK